MNSSNTISLNQQLANLRDIRLPEEFAWWMLAPGWWIAIASLCAGVFILWLIRKNQKNSIKSIALNELELIGKSQQNISISALATQISVLLHRIVISLNSDSKHTAEFGSNWQSFLTSNSKNMPENVAHILTLAPYATNEQIEKMANSENLSSADLIENTKKWIRSFA